MDGNGTKKLREEILTVLRTSDEIVRTFKSRIEGKYVIMFVGNTRSGKSTLINYFTDQQLVAFNKTGDYFKIELQDLEKKVATIGHGSLSHTTVPNVIEMQGDPDTLIVDAPGFDDNRGVLQEIINALYINQIKYAKGVRFVLVADSNNIIADNINYFLNFIETIEAILPDFIKLKEAVSIIFTKDWREYTKPEMVDLLKTKILNVHGMRGKKDLIHHFVDRDDLIGLFKMPTAAGPLTEDIDDNVHNAILNSSPINLNTSDIKFGLSKSASIFLLETYLEFHDIVIVLQKIFERFANLALEKFVCLKGDNLFILTSEQLEGNHNNIPLILNRFCVLIKNFKKEIVSAHQIPGVSRTLFVEELNNVCRELMEMDIDVPEVDYSPTSDLEDVQNKLEYIFCIEKIVEKDNKSKNILDSYQKNIVRIDNELFELLIKVYTEIAVREDLYRHVSVITNIEPYLEQVNNMYLSTSTLNELFKMKSQLHYYLQITDKIMSDINKRPVVKQLVQKRINEAILTRSLVLKKLQEITGYVKDKQNDALFKSFSSPVKGVIGTLICFVDFALFSYLNQPYRWPILAGSCLFVGFICWRSNYVRMRFSRLYHRYRQKRLLSEKTVLDNCCNIFLNED